MDNTLVSFTSGIEKLSNELQEEYKDRLDEVEGIFSLMEPYEGAIEAYNVLDKYYECHICSTAPWSNPSAWKDKLLWVKKHLPNAYKNITLTHNKQNVRGNYLIDDRLKNGAAEFKGQHIHFGQKGYETWEKVVDYLLTKDGFN